MATKDTKIVEVKKVSVEMTEKQKEEVIAFLAKQETEAALPKKEEEKRVDVELRFQHVRTNGVSEKIYGPGVVKNLPESIASSLFAADHKAYRSRLAEMESNSTNVQILQNGAAIMRPSV